MFSDLLFLLSSSGFSNTEHSHITKPDPSWHTMTPYIRNIYPIILALTMASCNGIKKDHQLFATSFEEILIDSVVNKNGVPKYSDPLLLGNEFKVTYASYGCFHSSATSIEVKKDNENYLVTLKYGNTNNPGKLFQLDSAFSIALANFSEFYYRVLKSQIKQTRTDNSTMGTINKLTIEGGFRTIELFCNAEAEINGFRTLINSIKYPVVK
jgi:hypothetical protein